MSHSLRVRIRRLHRSVGAVIAIGVLLIVASGILLNHGPGLKLDQPGVNPDWILDHYGIQIEAPESAWKVDQNWLSHCAGQLYFNDLAITPIGTLIGVTKLDDLLIAATPEQMLLLDPSGTLIEKLGSSALPGHLNALLANSDHIFVQTNAGWFSSDSNLLAWTAVSEPPSAIAAPAQNLPTALAKNIARHARSQELNWERVLADMHSGRFFGSWVPWLIDAMAIALALLAASGFWLWFKTTPRHH